ERERAVEILRRYVVDQLPSRAHAEFPGMSAASDGRVVLQLVSVLRVEAPSNCRAAIIERSQHLDGGVHVVGDLLIGGSKVLESGLIDRGSEYRRFGDLHGLMLRLQMVPARDQIEVSDAGILNIGVQ